MGKEKVYNIRKEELQNLYDKGLSIPEIAKNFKCSQSVIWSRIREYKIKLSRLRFINISKEELKTLYLKEKLSSRQIAKKYNCGKNAILKKLREFNISIRTKSETSKMINHPVKYNISKNDLVDLYYKKNLSPYQIAKIYDCSPGAIFHKMTKTYRIPLRGLFEAINLTIERRSRNIAKSVTKYPKNKFSNNLIERAYLIGFRVGDLYVKKNKYGQTIIVACSSTKQTQIDLLKSLFKKYGHFHISKRKNQFNFTCNLDTSFNFLLKKEDKIEEWILENKKYFFPFLAGYVDAEGHFGFDRSFGEFAISSYDKKIIKTIYKKLLKFGIEGRKPRISTRKGHIDKRGVRWNDDMWQFKITRKKELSKFIDLIEKYIKHQKRYKDMLNVKNNLLQRGVIENV